jgi:hypothetical protein
MLSCLAFLLSILSRRCESGKVGLTDFLGGCKFGREHPKGEHHAKGTKNLYARVQAGSSACKCAVSMR